jgi:hypothetical protein
MIKRTHISKAVAAALLAVSAQVAFAVDELEPNDSLANAQPVTVGTDGQVIIQGVLGTNDPAQPAIADVDFYSFQASDTDVITLDIDGGMKEMGSTERHVDTKITLFGPDGQVVLENDDNFTIDEGSASIGGDRDARIENLSLADTGSGKYVVAVTGVGRFLNGSYTLIISGVTVKAPSLVDYVNIDVRPGDRSEYTRVNMKQKRDLPIALLSRKAKGDMPAFKPLEAKVDTITFGRGGEEKSLNRCLKEHRDLNRDGIPDLVCLFDVPLAGFEENDVAGKLKGETISGTRFEAVGKLKVVAPDYRNKDRDRPDWHHGKGHGRDDDRHDGKHNRDDDRHDGKNRR